MDLTDIYGVFHPADVQCTFFSAVQETFSKIGHILGHKESLNKYKKKTKTEATSSILLAHKGIKL
jgi:hypothetical protein